MVYGVLILNADGYTMNFSNFFNEEGNDENRNIRVKFLMTRIQEKIVQQKLMNKEKSKIKDCLKDETIFNKTILMHFKESGIKDEDNTLVMEGCFNVDDKDLFKNEYTVIWRYVRGYCLALVLETDENIQLASYFMTIFFKKIGKVSKVEKNWAEVLKFFDTVMPGGNMTFFSQSYLAYLFPEVKKNSEF